jgi:hypothetical protein
MSGSREQSLPFGFTDYNYLCFSRLFHAYCFHPSWFDGVCSVCWRILWSSSLQNVLFSSITCCVLDPSIFLAPCLQTFPVCIIPLRKLPNFIHVRNIQLNYCVLYILNFAIVDLNKNIHHEIRECAELLSSSFCCFFFFPITFRRKKECEVDWNEVWRQESMRQHGNHPSDCKQLLATRGWLFVRDNTWQRAFAECAERIIDLERDN